MAMKKKSKPPVIMLAQPPVIMSAHGPVTESARRQAIINMRLDPLRQSLVLGIITREMGGDRELGLKEARRRYPE